MQVSGRWTLGLSLKYGVVYTNFRKATQIYGSFCPAVCRDPSSAPAASTLMDDDAGVGHEISHEPNVNWPVVAQINKYSSLSKIQRGRLGRPELVAGGAAMNIHAPSASFIMVTSVH